MRLMKQAKCNCVRCTFLAEYNPVAAYQSMQSDALSEKMTCSLSHH